MGVRYKFRHSSSEAKLANKTKDKKSNLRRAETKEDTPSEVDARQMADVQESPGMRGPDGSQNASQIQSKIHETKMFLISPDFSPVLVDLYESYIQDVGSNTVSLEELLRDEQGRLFFEDFLEYDIKISSSSGNRIETELKNEELHRFRFWYNVYMFKDGASISRQIGKLFDFALKIWYQFLSDDLQACMKACGEEEYWEQAKRETSEKIFLTSNPSDESFNCVFDDLQGKVLAALSQRSFISFQKFLHERIEQMLEDMNTKSGDVHIEEEVDNEPTGIDIEEPGRIEKAVLNNEEEKPVKQNNIENSELYRKISIALSEGSSVLDQVESSIESETEDSIEDTNIEPGRLIELGAIEGCLDFFRKHQRITIEGIFRINGNEKKVKRVSQFYVDSYHAGDELVLDRLLDQKMLSIHDIASLMKRLIKVLNDQIFKMKYNINLTKAYKKTKDKSDKKAISAIQKEMQKIKNPRPDLFCKLISFLREAAMYDVQNGMKAYNLAVCFAPCLLPFPDSENPLAGSLIRIDLLQFLIEKRFDLIPPKPSEVVSLSRISITDDDLKIIPGCVRECVEFLWSSEKVCTKNLFSIPGGSKMADVKNYIKKNGGETDNLIEEFKLESPHDVAATLKFYLSGLNEPLIPKDSFREISSIYEEHFRHQESLNQLNGKVLQVLKNLPEQRRLTLCYIILFLNEVSSYSAENKMSIDSLALLFVPSLVGIRGQFAYSKTLEANIQIKLCQKMLGRLIENGKEFAVLNCRSKGRKEKKSRFSSTFIEIRTRLSSINTELRDQI